MFTRLDLSVLTCKCVFYWPDYNVEEWSIEFFTSLNAEMTKYIGSLLGFAKYLNLKKKFNISFWLFSTR